MDKENKKLLIISIIGVALFITAITSVSYAFYTSTVKHNNEGVSAQETTKVIKAEFEDGDGQLNTTNMVPGDTFTKSFTLKNTGTAPINYRIVVKNLENDFARPQDIQYQITKGEENIKEWTQFPSGNNGGSQALSDQLTLTAGEGESENSETFTITIQYKNDPSVSQNEDMGKKIGGEIFIEEYDGEDE